MLREVFLLLVAFSSTHATQPGASKPRALLPVGLGWPFFKQPVATPSRTVRAAIETSGQAVDHGAWLPRSAAPASSTHNRMLLQARNWNFTAPLRICTASIQDFGARCNGAPDPSLDDAPQPIGPVPTQGWCPAGENFCGYDVAVFECASLTIACALQCNAVMGSKFTSTNASSDAALSLAHSSGVHRRQRTGCEQRCSCLRAVRWPKTWA